MHSFPTHAMVLAAGFGTRMRPITDTLPKPLVSVGGKTLLDWSLDHLADAQVENAVVNSHHLAPVLEAHIAKRMQRTQHPHITISHEKTILETGGGVAKALPLLGTQPFFIINSDILWLDGNVPLLKRLAEAWDENRMDMLLTLHPVEHAIGYDGKGDFALEGDTIIRPDTEGKLPYVFAGIMIAHPRIFTDLPPSPFSLNIFFKRARQADGTLKRIAGLVHDGEWLHIGTPEGISNAEKHLHKISKPSIINY